MGLRIVIPGGTGQVGRILARYFHAKGHEVTVLARHVSPARWRVLPWNGRDTGDWVKAIDGADVVINLAGRNVNCRYNEQNRREIMDSRVDATRAIGRAIELAQSPPPLWLNAATATIFRHALDRPMDEATGELGGAEADAPSTWRFSIDVARSWEKALFEMPAPGTRKIALRSSMIMSPDHGGVFDVLLRLVRFGLGGTAGSGEQFVSWIHDLDFVRAIEFLFTATHLDGCINVCSPEPLPNRTFMRDLREAYGMPVGVPATTWMLEAGAFFLRTETELILKSRRVVPGRLSSAGFAFDFPKWPAAARDLVSRWRRG
ncbi:MAG TPA: TIGR01777 family oxidoreductase [Bryobacteraceae bacterium]|jgi:hypothetical protein